MRQGNRHHSENEEESIFISMTDIMVGLLFIFILIIMYFALQAKLDSEVITSQEDVLVELYAEINEDDEGRQRRKSLDIYLQGVTAQRESILKWLKSYLVNAGIESVELDIQSGILRLPEGVLFGSGRYSIASESQADFAAKILAEALSEVLPCSVMSQKGVPYKKSKDCRRTLYHNTRKAYIETIFIEGHTDNVAITQNLAGAPLLKTNLKLSARRATNAFEKIIFHVPKLIEFYAPISSGNIPVLAVSAYGASRPLNKNVTKLDRGANRRIDLRILMHKPDDSKAHRRLLTEIGQYQVEKK